MTERVLFYHVLHRYFYRIPATKREAFEQARRMQKNEVQRRFLLFRWSVVRGDRWLYEHLGELAESESLLPFSGFFLSSYLFEFVTFPPEVTAALNAAALDDYHFLFSPDVAAGVSDHLASNPPALHELLAFGREHGPGSEPEAIATYFDTHRYLLEWMRSISPTHFGVLHLSF